MMRLIFSDLRDHAATWIGAFAIALVCGYLGGWVVSIEATTASYKNLESFSFAVAIFSILAAVPVLVSASNLTVAAQKRSYALWQLGNASPCRVSVVVLFQLVIVAMLGALVGTFIEAATYTLLFFWVFSSYAPPSDIALHVGVPFMPIVWVVVSGIFLAGGFTGARSAGCTPPLVALRGLEPKRCGMTWLRALLFVGLAVVIWQLVAFLVAAEGGSGLPSTMYVPLLVPAALTALAPVVFSTLLNAWTSLVPHAHWNVWYLARHMARFGLSTSTAVETPIMLGFGLIAGIFSLGNSMAVYAQQLGMFDFNTTLDWTSSILLLGGPVLLCATGAAVSVVMSSRSRARDVALLVSCGARPLTLLAAAVCEALIHTITATLVGVAAVVISNALVCAAVDMPLFDYLTFGEGFIVSLIGFALVLVATLVPTWVALNRETAPALAACE